jgi:hypothetical protein
MRGSGRKATAISGDRSLEPPIESLDTFGDRLATRRAALADTLPAAKPRSERAPRTPSKRALLKAIDKAAAKEGLKW